MEEKERKSAPYNTRNAALAVALSALGVPWAQSEDGKPVGVWNTYTINALRGIETARREAGKPPLGLAGKSLEDGVRLAFMAWEVGSVEYLFQRTPTLYAILEGWDQQAKIIAAADETDPNTRTKGDPIMVMPEQAGRIACQLARTRKDFFGAKGVPPLWRRVLPIALRSDASSKQTNPRESREGCVISGSYEAHTVTL